MQTVSSIKNKKMMLWIIIVSAILLILLIIRLKLKKINVNRQKYLLFLTKNFAILKQICAILEKNNH